MKALNIVNTKRVFVNVLMVRKYQNFENNKESSIGIDRAFGREGCCPKDKKMEVEEENKNNFI